MVVLSAHTIEIRPMLQLRDIHFTYPGRAPRETISGLTLEVCAGEVVALLGPNGSGKSTLLSIAIGALKPDRGEVYSTANPSPGFRAARSRKEWRWWPNKAPSAFR